MNVRKQNPFFMLCFFEYFERFGYYGFSYTSILFFMSNNGFNFDETQAVLLFGSFAALSYVFNAVGGVIADRVLGIKRTMFVGGVMLLIGYALLAISAMIVFKPLIYVAVATVVLGAALFKPAPTNLISRIYTDHSKIDSLYTIFYMSINLGSLTASLFIPYLASNFGYTFTYSLCSVGFILAIANTLLSYGSIKNVDNSVGHLSLNISMYLKLVFGILSTVFLLSVILAHGNLADLVLWGGALLIFTIFGMQIFVEKDPLAKRKILVAIVLLFYAVVFFCIYQQKFTSFLLFNIHHVDLHFLGFSVNAQSVPGVLNTAGVVLLSPILATIYIKLKDRDLCLPHKFALGILLCGSAYGVLFLACFLNVPTSKISIWWEVLAITVCFSSAELLISALGLALMAKLLPKRIMGFAMGTWFITSAIGIKLGTMIATYTSSGVKYDTSKGFDTETTIASYYGYQHLFGSIFVVAFVIAIFAFLIGKKLNKMIQE
ncbi:peptide MFS transporter [Francisella adeliensis]|uniref:MFS transporter n=1 Tax=Francisella adeliensis TaxID=2007306 RepID=A0A2Z4XYE4_9GAMM|nr:oligopeptide:H+ symporter [Francisella adeliensis]AXA33901.1 MFS transporter [Francisella adeliensis]MBK2085804.1 MFS transporter [Francisella adeliensis]MBK2097682.1 MFS transporter [Francisella adeliensis]QIW12136.1 MFS transporter [Francisella adeliensis]QIW14010.1 MFS transporter [Francisella adeliensis]